MKNFGPQRMNLLCASAMVLSIWFAGSNLSAAPCIKTRAQQDGWVEQGANALVRLARAAFENDK